MTSQPLPPVNPRDLSYALSAKTGVGQVLVRCIENMTGRFGLLYRLYGYDKDVAAGEPIWDVAWRRYNLSMTQTGAGEIPRTGPSIVVANHPFGILDGLTIGYLLSRQRDDFKIVANVVFDKAAELSPYILPIDFSGGRDAARANIAARKQAAAYVKNGGCVVIFPGGAVSASPQPRAAAFDPKWGVFTAKLAAESGAPITPVKFEGDNTRAFHNLSHYWPLLRIALHMYEFKRRVATTVPVVVGESVSTDDLATSGPDAAARADWLRSRVYALGAAPAHNPPYGKRWE